MFEEELVVDDDSIALFVILFQIMSNIMLTVVELKYGYYTKEVPSFT